MDNLMDLLRYSCKFCGVIIMANRAEDLYSLTNSGPANPSKKPECIILDHNSINAQMCMCRSSQSYYDFQIHLLELH
ncbi:MAG: hypothetical protein EZS28_044246 [Streblomastix strix]|uniref:Uncharacterized protein n=1 Tax=Streblomastix strix TaxID=222440 RepID=A0A5J4TPL1_9EUKA|nr:MAG: hypothetical protein EZS28_044246 [Streblomastix strix]